MLQKILNLFQKTPDPVPVEEFVFPSGNASVTFPAGWQMIRDGKDKYACSFVQESIEGALYAFEMTNEKADYQYDPQKSLEIAKDHAPELLAISDYGAVMYQRTSEGSELIFRHYEIGYRRTLLQFTWISRSTDADYTSAIESILQSVKID